MRNIFVLLLATIFLFSCDKSAIEVKSSTNPEFVIELLFQHDGIKVYRFSDGYRRHYFTNKGETISTHTKMIGKTVTHYDENIQ